VLAERVELALEIRDGACWWSGGQPALQGLVEALSLSLRLGVAGGAVLLADPEATGRYATETKPRILHGEAMAEKTIVRHAKIAGHPFVLRNSEVVHALREIEPEPITSHFVVVAGRRFPPKQVVSEITGLDRADFTTHQARRTLIRLGFPAGRRVATTPSSRRTDVQGQTDPAYERLADRLRPLSGQWVAIKSDDILHASPSPQELVGWLGQHGQRADSMFRVPEDELATTGLAPL